MLLRGEEAASVTFGARLFVSFQNTENEANCGLCWASKNLHVFFSFRGLFACLSPVLGLCVWTPWRFLPQIPVSPTGSPYGYLDFLYHSLFVPWTIRITCRPFVPWTIRPIDRLYHLYSILYCHCQLFRPYVVQMLLLQLSYIASEL